MPYSSQPLLLDEFTRLMSAFPFPEAEPTIAVAVSGGPDSLALSLLLHQWGKKNILALTVDHGLRTGSDQEALLVQSWMQRYAIPHKILTWQGVKPRTRIQETARHMRYSLLTQACREHNITTLLTGHQAYDQVETFLMRLARGSGPRGLCAIRPVSHVNGLKLVRPLLTVPPGRLRATLEHFKRPCIEDPSNQNKAFERVRWRQLWLDMTSRGLTLDGILSTIERLQDNQCLVDTYLSDLQTKIVTVSPYGYLMVDWKQAKALPVEILHGFMAVLLQLFSSKSWNTPYIKIKDLCRLLLQSDRRVFTLGGVILQNKGPDLFLFREPRALPQPQILSAGPHKILWDFRFDIDICVPKNETWILRPLPPPFQKAIPQRAAVSLPSLWHRDTLLCAPGLENEFTHAITPHWKDSPSQ